MELEALLNQTLSEKYQLNSLLGQGGMGAIYQATHLGTRRSVALKIILPKYMSQQAVLERFRREAEAVGSINHPNVVNVTDFGFATFENETLAYLVMEFLKGETLSELLERKGKLSPSLVADLLGQLCSAMQESHRLGIIHRDLKPANLWIESDRRKGYTLKVLDFGVAKWYKSTDSQESSANFKESFASQVLLEEKGEKGQKNTRKLLPVSDQVSKTELLLSVPTPEKTRLMDTPPILGEGQIKPIDSPVRKEESDTKHAFSREEKTSIAVAENAHLDTQETRAINTQELLVWKPVELETNEKRDSSKTLTQAGSFVGTPLYMSPEQCLGRPVDPRSDLYSIGLITYQMLANEHPFAQCDSTYAMLIKHLKEQPPPLKNFCKDLSTSAADLVHSTFATDPSERPQDVAHYARSFQASVEREIETLHRTISLLNSNGIKVGWISAVGFMWTAFGLIALLVCPLITVFQTPLWIFSLTLLFLFTQLFTGFLASCYVIPLATQWMENIYHQKTFQNALKLGSKKFFLFTWEALKNFWLVLSPPLLLVLLLQAETFLPPDDLARLYQYKWSSVFVGLLMLGGSILLAFRQYLRYVMLPAVFFLEEKQGKSLRERAEVLGTRVHGAIRVLFPSFLLMVVAVSILTIVLVHTLLRRLGEGFSLVESTTEVAAVLLGVSFSLLFSLLLLPVVYFGYALAYLKAREVGGELLEEMEFYKKLVKD